MRVSLGTDQAVESRTRQVYALEHSKVELIKMAEALPGVTTDGDKETLAARISATPERRRLPEPRVCDIEFPEGTSLSEAFTTITARGGLWSYHSDSPATWVESDSPGLSALLAEHFGCPEGAPGDLEDTHWTRAGRPGVRPEDAQ